MPRFYVNNNAQPTGEHEVHEQDCAYLKETISKTDLGIQPNCLVALMNARKYHEVVDGCKHCIPKCHKV